MTGPRPEDARHMRRAIALARRAAGRTGPNPLVGAVVVKGGRVVGEGYHRRAGTPHAEVLALAAAGEAARGADLYVNLEPCHHHGLTPPCTDAIIAAGVRRVVAGMVDPNPLVNGRGLAALEEAGVAVTAGVLGEACAELNAEFVVYITERRPFVTYKSAITLDGRVAARDGSSRWVTGEAARRAAHRLRDRHQAIVVGVGTVLADDPRLTCRLPRGRDPLRVVLDAHLRTPPGAAVVRAASSSAAGTLVVTTAGADAARARALEAAGAEVLRLPASGAGRVSLPHLMAALRERRIMSALLEGGPTLAGAFWEASLVDRVAIFIAPKVLGDPAALPWMRGPAVPGMGAAVRLEGLRVRRVGDDLLVTGRVARRRAAAAAREVAACSRG